MGANVGFEELSRRAVDDREPSRLTLCRPGEAVNVSLLYFPDLQNSRLRYSKHKRCYRGLVTKARIRSGVVLVQTQPSDLHRLARRPRAAMFILGGTLICKEDNLGRKRRREWSIAEKRRIVAEANQRNTTRSSTDPLAWVGQSSQPHRRPQDQPDRRPAALAVYSAA